MEDIKEKERESKGGRLDGLTLPLLKSLSYIRQMKCGVYGISHFERFMKSLPFLSPLFTNFSNKSIY